MKIGRVAFIIGHDEKRKGALAVAPISQYEYDYNTEIANLALKFSSDTQVEAKVFNRNAGLEKCYEQVNEWADCAIELHFNASADSSVGGCETLYDAEPKENVFFAALVQQGALNAIHYSPLSDDKFTAKRNRRTKLLKAGDRGHYNLSLAKVPSVIAEPFFGSNAEDTKKASDPVRKEAYARELLIAAESFIRVFLRR